MDANSASGIGYKHFWVFPIPGTLLEKPLCATYVCSIVCKQVIRFKVEMLASDTTTPGECFKPSRTWVAAAVALPSSANTELKSTEQLYPLSSPKEHGSFYGPSSLAECA